MDHDQLKQMAKDAGYSDAKFDGLYLTQFLACRCSECLQAYEDGQEAAFAELAEEDCS